VTKNIHVLLLQKIHTTQNKIIIIIYMYIYIYIYIYPNAASVLVIGLTLTSNRRFSDAPVQSQALVVN